MESPREVREGNNNRGFNEATTDIIIIGNQGSTFSAGANLALLLLAAIEGDFDDIQMIYQHQTLLMVFLG